MQEINLDRSIGRLEGKMDLALKDIGELKGAFATLEAGRLSRLETIVAGLTARVAIISAGLPIAVSIMWAVIQHYWFK